jgi:type IV secretion system protein VirB2
MHAVCVDVLTELEMNMKQMTINQQQTKRLLFALTLAACISVLAIEPAFAGTGGFDKASATVDKVVTFLTTLAIGVVTAAIMWAGYKVLFLKNTLSDISNILIGGTLIGGAAGAAAWLIG